MSKKTLLLVIFVSQLFYGCASSQPDTPVDYEQIRPMEFGGELLLPGGERIEDKYFRSFFYKTDYILLGEQHTNMTDHMSQAIILEKMARRHLKPMLGMEMISLEKQPVLDKFNQGGLSVDELKIELDWQNSVGFSFEFYRPIFETASTYNIPVYALNLPRRIVRETRLNGLDSISAEDKKYLPETFIPASDEQRKELIKVFSGHLQRGSEPDPQNNEQNINTAPTDHLPPADAPQASALATDPSLALATSGDEASAGTELRKEDNSPTSISDGTAPAPVPSKALESYITAQGLWDSTMAWQAALLRKQHERPVVIIVGQGHVEYGWGIARRLQVYHPEAKTLCVMPWRAPMESALMQQHDSPLLDSGLPAVFPPPDMADLYYYSPATMPGKAPQGFITGQNPEADEFQLIVLSVTPKSKAEKAGLKAGDVIVKVDKRVVQDNNEFYGLLSQGAAYSRSNTLTILRGNEKIDVTLPIW